jgi:hypothetical protein
MHHSLNLKFYGCISQSFCDAIDSDVQKCRTVYLRCRVNAVHLALRSQAHSHCADTTEPQPLVYQQLAERFHLTAQPSPGCKLLVRFHRLGKHHICTHRARQNIHTRPLYINRLLIPPTVSSGLISTRALTIMASTKVLQQGLKCPANDDSIDIRRNKFTKVTKIGKVFASEAVCALFDGLSQRIQANTSNFIARQELVHNILMAQRELPAGAMPSLQDAGLDSIVAPSVTPSEHETIVGQLTTAPVVPDFQAVVVNDTTAVRRSGRSRQIVDYNEGSSSESLPDAIPSNSAKRSAHKTSKVSKTSAAKTRAKSLKQPPKIAPKQLSKKAGNAGTRATPRSALSAALVKSSCIVVLKVDKEVLKKLATNNKDECRNLEAALTLLKLSWPQNFEESSLRRGEDDMADRQAISAAAALQQLNASLLPTISNQSPQALSRSQHALTYMLNDYYQKNSKQPAPPVPSATPTKTTRSSTRHQPADAKHGSMVTEAKSMRALKVSGSAASEALQLTPPAAHTSQSPTSTSPTMSYDATPDDMPSDMHSCKFQSAGPSNRTRAQLDALLQPPARPKQFPLDLHSAHKIPLSHYGLSSMPQLGIADKLVQGMEARHALEVKRWDDSDDEMEGAWN